MTAEIISFPMTEEMQRWVESVCAAIQAQAKAIEMQQKKIEKMADAFSTLKKWMAVQEELNQRTLEFMRASGANEP